MPIPDIRLNNLRIRDVVVHEVPRWMSTDPPHGSSDCPSSYMEVGTPIVNIPGCVEAHKDNDRKIQI